MSAEEINIYLYSMSWMCMYKCESIPSIPDSSLRVSCALVKPCSTPSTLSSHPLPLASLSPSVSHLHNGRSERASAWAHVRGWMYREKGWSHCTARCWKAARISSFPSLLFLSLYLIGCVIPPSASQGCHRPMIKQRNPPPPHTHTHTHLLSCNPLLK